MLNLTTFADQHSSKDTKSSRNTYQPSEYSTYICTGLVLARYRFIKNASWENPSTGAELKPITIPHKNQIQVAHVPNKKTNTAASVEFNNLADQHFSQYTKRRWYTYMYQPTKHTG